MREAINSNPLVQAAVVGVLILGAAFFFVTSGGGGEEEEAASGETTQAVEAPTAEAPSGAGEAATGAAEAATEGAASASAAGLLAGADAPPLPRSVVDAYKANRTIVLLVVHDGGIDDRIVKSTTEGLAGFGDATVFVVPAEQISRYTAITEGVGVDRVPALVVVTPKQLDGSIPTASVSYGFQSPASIAQAVIDAGYKGPTVDYHP